MKQERQSNEFTHQKNEKASLDIPVEPNESWYYVPVRPDQDDAVNHLSMPTIFVTGATGFIGREVVKQLHDAGIRVVALLRTPTKRSLIETYVDDFIIGDLYNEEAISEGVMQADVILHLASGLHRPWDQAIHRDNINGTQLIAELCARSSAQPHLIIVSSLAARGPSRLGTTSPISAYGKAKRAAEDAAAKVYHSERISIVRPPMVFGPDDQATRPIFDAIRRGLVPVLRDPAARFSMIDVRDLASGLLKTCQHPPFGINSPLYLAYREELNMTQLTTIIGAQLDHTIRFISIPKWGLWLVANLLELMARMSGGTTPLNRDKYLEMTNGPWTCNPTETEKRLDWCPKHPITVRLMDVYKSYLS